MQIVLTFVIALMATTVQAGLLRNLPLVGNLGSVTPITKNLPVVGPLLNTLPIVSTVDTLPIVSDLKLDGVPPQGLGGVVEQLLVVVDQTLNTLLSGIGNDVSATNVAVNVADVVDLDKVADVGKVADVANVANVAKVV